MFKGINGLMQAMREAQSIQSRMGELQGKLADIHAEGSAGGGMVTVVANGQQQLLSCRIEPELLASPDKELLEELVVAAANQALLRARETAAQEMTGVIKGLDLSQFGGPADGDDTP